MFGAALLLKNYSKFLLLMYIRTVECEIKVGTSKGCYDSLVIFKDDILSSDASGDIRKPSAPFGFVLVFRASKCLSLGDVPFAYVLEELLSLIRISEAVGPA
jgi:hypothetical protein